MQARELAKSKKKKNAWRVCMCGFDLCVKIIEFKRQHTHAYSFWIMLGELLTQTFYLSLSLLIVI